jgi:glutathione synthase/RimK-type ligase-like ATP-grasp enzyme
MVGDLAFHIDDVTGVHCRFALEKGVDIPIATPVAEFAMREHHAALSGLLRCVDRRRWINFPFDEGAADGKIASLRAAARHGLNVPPFIVTSDARAIERFGALHGEVVIKPLSDASIALQEGRFVTMPEFAAYSAPYSAAYDGSEDEDDVDETPTLVQARIAKRSDVRAVVVDDRIIATAVPAIDGDPLDVRLVRCRPGTPHALPDALCARLRALHRALGLRFSAVDLIHGIDGQYFVVDINPQGNWLADDDETSRAITREIADALLGCSTDAKQ